MTPIHITSRRDNPPLSGWFGLGMALLCAGLSVWAAHTPTERLVLRGCTVLFAVAGGTVLVWSPRRLTRFDPGARQILVEDRSTFGRTRRTLPFEAVAEVLVQDWEDPDPDLRPFKRVLFWVALRLHSGEELVLTDQAADAAPARALQAELQARLAG